MRPTLHLHPEFADKKQENQMDQLINFITQYGIFLGIPVIFLVIVIWIYRPSAKKRYEADGNLPFYGDKKPDKTRQGGH